MELTKERKAKMQDGRSKYLVKETGLIWKINDDIEVSADRHQLILRVRKDYTFYADWPDLLDELLNLKIKALLTANEENDVRAVLAAINDARAWLEGLSAHLPLPKIDINRNDGEAK